MTRTRGAGIVLSACLVLAAFAAPAAAFAWQRDTGDGAAACRATHGDRDCPVPAAEDPRGEIPAAEAPSDETPSGEPQSTPAPTDGEVVYDGPFLTPTPDPTPAGDVLDATGAPDMTPPSTDSLEEQTAPVAGTSLQLLLVAVVGLSLMVVCVGRVPSARRS